MAYREQLVWVEVLQVGGGETYGRAVLAASAGTAAGDGCSTEHRAGCPPSPRRGPPPPARPALQVVDQLRKELCARQLACLKQEGALGGGVLAGAGGFADLAKRRLSMCVGSGTWV